MATTSLTLNRATLSGIFANGNIPTQENFTSIFETMASVSDTNVLTGLQTFTNLVTASDVELSTGTIVGNAGTNTVSGVGICTDADKGGSSILGGTNNVISSSASFIGGGSGNIITSESPESTILAGFQNFIEANDGMIGVGCGNRLLQQADGSVIISGRCNTIRGTLSSVILGGEGNIIGLGLEDTTVIRRRDRGGFLGSIFGGTRNSVFSAGYFVFSIDPNTGAALTNNLPVSSSSGPVIITGCNNTIETAEGFIGGGSNNTITLPESGMFGGGFGNKLPTYPGSSILNGNNNSISAADGFIGSGNNNVLSAGAESGSILGGTNNVIAASGGTIASGNDNCISEGGEEGTILGGNSNTVEITGGFIGGGTCNIICRPRKGPFGFPFGRDRCRPFIIPSTIISGQVNTISGAEGAFIGGGTNNTIDVSGHDGFISSGNTNTIQVSGGSIIGGSGNILSAGDGGLSAAFIETNSVTAVPESILSGFPAMDSTIIGSQDSCTTGKNSAIIGSCRSYALGTGTTVIGSTRSKAVGINATVIGSYRGTSNTGSTVVGSRFTIAGGSRSFIASSCLSNILGPIRNTNSNVIIGSDKSNIRSGSFDYGISNSIIAGGFNNAISGVADRSVNVGGCNNDINASDSTITGGFDNYIGTAACNSTIVGGFNNTVSSSGSLVAGASANTINSGGEDSVILGGGQNVINNPEVTIIGSVDSISCDNDIGFCPTKNAIIIGGQCNTVRGSCTLMGGGQCNEVAGLGNVQIGGCRNVVTRGAGGGSFAIGVGGFCNCTCGGGSSVVGGCCNGIIDNYQIGGMCLRSCHSFIGGGAVNCIAGCDSAIVGARCGFLSGENSFIGGGRCVQSCIGSRNFAQVKSNILVGGLYNTLSGAYQGGIIGGCRNESCSTDGGIIIGGVTNRISLSAPVYGHNKAIFTKNATVIGGRNNVIQRGDNTFVAGGSGLSAFHDNSAIIGGTTISTVSSDMLHADKLYLGNLPTSNPNLPGVVWNDSGTLKISV